MDLSSDSLREWSKGWHLGQKHVRAKPGASNSKTENLGKEDFGKGDKWEERAFKSSCICQEIKKSACTLRMRCVVRRGPTIPQSSTSGCTHAPLIQEMKTKAELIKA